MKYFGYKKNSNIKEVYEYTDDGRYVFTYWKKDNKYHKKCFEKIHGTYDEDALLQNKITSFGASILSDEEIKTLLLEVKLYLQ